MAGRGLKSNKTVVLTGLYSSGVAVKNRPLSLLHKSTMVGRRKQGDKEEKSQARASLFSLDYEHLFVYYCFVNEH
jgi:hypothetical protein